MINSCGASFVSHIRLAAARIWRHRSRRQRRGFCTRTRRDSAANFFAYLLTLANEMCRQDAVKAISRCRPSRYLLQEERITLQSSLSNEKSRAERKVRGASCASSSTRQNSPPGVLVLSHMVAAAAAAAAAASNLLASCNSPEAAAQSETFALDLLAR